MAIRTLIVDDEPLARERLRLLLAGEPDFPIAGECAGGRDAVSFIKRQPVDLVLLDIQMPEMNGFEVVKAIAPHRLPHIIFVTAYDRYALDAFAVHALDYLLKPVDPARLRSAIEHVRASGGDWQDRVTKLLDNLHRPPAPERILLKVDGEVNFVDPNEIGWVEAAGNYVNIHLRDHRKFLRETLSAMERKLSVYGFLRISRSVVVNTGRIKTMKPVGFGEYSIQLLDATELTLSRGYREAFFARFTWC